MPDWGIFQGDISVQRERAEQKVQEIPDPTRCSFSARMLVEGLSSGIHQQTLDPLGKASLFPLLEPFK